MQKKETLLDHCNGKCLYRSINITKNRFYLSTFCICLWVFYSKQILCGIIVNFIYYYCTTFSIILKSSLSPYLIWSLYSQLFFLYSSLHTFLFLFFFIWFNYSYFFCWFLYSLTPCLLELPRVFLLGSRLHIGLIQKMLFFYFFLYGAYV